MLTAMVTPKNRKSPSAGLLRGSQAMFKCGLVCIRERLSTT